MHVQGKPGAMTTPAPTPKPELEVFKFNWAYLGWAGAFWARQKTLSLSLRP